MDKNYLLYGNKYPFLFEHTKCSRTNILLNQHGSLLPNAEQTGRKLHLFQSFDFHGAKVSVFIDTLDNQYVKMSIASEIFTGIIQFNVFDSNNFDLFNENSQRIFSTKGNPVVAGHPLLRDNFGDCFLKTIKDNFTEDVVGFLTLTFFPRITCSVVAVHCLLS